MSQNEYYTSRVDKQKIYLDKAYTTVEWLTSEKRKIQAELSTLNETTLKVEEYHAFKEIVDKDIRLMKNRQQAHEIELRRTDNYIEKRLPLDTLHLFAEMLEYVIPNKKTQIMEFLEYKLDGLNKIIEHDNGWPNLNKGIGKEQYHPPHQNQNHHDTLDSHELFNEEHHIHETISSIKSTKSKKKGSHKKPKKSNFITFLYSISKFS